MCFIFNDQDVGDSVVFRTEASLGESTIVSDGGEVRGSLSVHGTGVGLRTADPARLLFARSAPRWVWFVVPSASSMLRLMWFSDDPRDKLL